MTKIYSIHSQINMIWYFCDPPYKDENLNLILKI